MNFFNIIEHLLPRGRSFSLTIQKTLKSFIEGLSQTPTAIKDFFYNIYLDLFAMTTTQLEQWEFQFGIISTGLTEDQRRQRLDARWKEIGGQSPKYIQDTLQSYGFDVYVHEWWEIGTEPSVNVKACATPRNPLQYISDNGDIIYTIQCGEPLAQCGEPLAQCGQTLGKLGYALVNKVYEPSLAFMQCGENLAQCGETLAQCGETLGYGQKLKKYTIPNDVTKFPYFLYIGSSTFGEFATIDPKRRDEFERLCLRICPNHIWLGIMVQYE